MPCFHWCECVTVKPFNIGTRNGPVIRQYYLLSDGISSICTQPDIRSVPHKSVDNLCAVDEVWLHTDEAPAPPFPCSLNYALNGGVTGYLAGGE